MTPPEITEPLQPVVERLEEWWHTGLGMLPDLVVALLVVVIGLGLGTLARRATRSTLLRVSDNRQVASLLAHLAFLVVLSAGTFLALGVLGLDKTVTSLLAGAGVLGLALGFAAQTLAANLISGVIIAVRRPFRLGEWIACGALQGCSDLQGRVEQVDLNVSTLRTADGRLVRVPNRLLLEQALVNLSRTGQRRVEVVVGCSYGDDLRHALEVTRQALQDLPGASADRPVEVQATGFGDSSIALVAWAWGPWASPGDESVLRTEMVVRIQEAWREAGLTIPFPIRTLDFGIVGGRSLSEESLTLVIETDGRVARAG